jgi:hypothetical protein
MLCCAGRRALRAPILSLYETLALTNAPARVDMVVFRR